MNDLELMKADYLHHIEGTYAIKHMLIQSYAFNCM